MAGVDLVALPPAEAVRFFRDKGFRIGFDWREVWGQEHARAFTVAKAMRLDILADIRTALDDAIAKGETFQDFAKKLTPVLQEKGWWGRRAVIDPRTGESVAAQLGSPRRLRVMFDANLRSAVAAGRWERMERTKDRRPYLRYVAVLDSRTRPEHRAWHGTILPHDDPFWDTHFPPNGWSCRCQVQQLSDRDLERRNLEVTDRPEVKTRPYRNARTGETVEVPEGIDPGWGHNIGKGRMDGLTPPPRSGPLPTPYSGPPAGSAMPAPRTAPASRLLPRGQSPDSYVARFLAEFGATAERPAVFTDVIGEPVVIGDALFRRPGGGLKVTVRGRERALLLLADTIKSPDEIWWQWEEHPPGRFTLLRRYMARWRVAGEDVPAFVLFDVGPNGWTGVTAFDPERASYIMRQRGGTLAWRRAPNE